jgi:DNA-binding GntR family transcriptional regulator
LVQRHTEARIDLIACIPLAIAGAVYEPPPLAVDFAPHAEFASPVAVPVADHRDVEAARPNPNIKAYLAPNYVFHFAIYNASGNRDLVDQIEILWMRYGPVLNLLRRSDVSFLWHAHHVDLINAVKADDPEAAVAALTADLEDAASLIATHQ